MIDGYSVPDTATILGVPEARVWELIARGVLAGRPEVDGGMRVFLKASASAPEAPTTNGGTGHEVELSPFRELLTEFRNLTERYGQALLALGEARGEVAALRSRVDLLEARMDLRLPPGRPISTVAWDVPEGAAATPEAQPAPAPEAPHVPEASQETDASQAPEAIPGPDAFAPDTAQSAPEVQLAPAGDEPPAMRRRARGLAAAAGFAEALAPTQDPELPELPGAREAADALAALQSGAPPGLIEPEAAEEAEVAAEVAQEAAAEPDEEATGLVAETGAAAPSANELAEELPSAPESPEIEEPAPSEAATWAGATEPPSTRSAPPSPYTTEMVEPDWFADGDFSWLEQAQAAEVEAAPEAEPEVAADAEPEADSLGPEDAAASPTADVSAQAVPYEPPFTPVDLEVDLPGQAGAIEAEPIEAEPIEAETPAPQLPEETPSAEDTWPSPEEVSSPAPLSPEADEAPGQPPASGPDAEPSGSEPTANENEVELMWLGDEFEQAELEQPTAGWPAEEWAGGASPRLVSHDERSWPGAEMSDEQLTRLAREEGWQPDEVEAIRSFLGRGGGEESTEDPPRAQPPAPGDADWLRGRRGTAATAYRRLRRLFPG